MKNFSEMDFRVSTASSVSRQMSGYNLIQQIRQHIRDYFLQTYSYDIGQVPKINFLAVNRGEGEKAKEIHIWLAVELGGEHVEVVLPLVKITDIFRFRFPARRAIEFFPKEVLRYFIEEHRTI